MRLYIQLSVLLIALILTNVSWASPTDKDAVETNGADSAFVYDKDSETALSPETLLNDMNAEYQFAVQLAYISLDFCFASHVANCRLHGYELNLILPVGDIYTYFSVGQLYSQNPSTPLLNLEVLSGEVGIGIPFSLSDSLEIKGELGYYNANETEEAQNNSISGYKAKIILEQEIGTGLLVGLSATHDRGQNSSDYRDHGLRGRKPKFNYTTGELFSKLQYTNKNAVILEISRIIAPANSRKTTEGDPDTRYDGSSIDYQLIFERKFSTG